jgi:thiopeptide-type bacteriocin biosynthesis protein
MPTERPRYHPAGPVLVRASTDPGGLDLGALPELSDSAASAREGIAWLAAQWARVDVREAISLASPDLAARIGQLVAQGPSAATASTIRRAVLATTSYLLRWQRRTTPFGLFAALTTAAIGAAAAKVGNGHRVVAHADGDWVTALADGLEQHPRLRRRLSLVTDNAGFVRDGRFIVAGRPRPGERTPGLPREISVRYTPAVRTALAYASRPVQFGQLAARLAAELPDAEPTRIEAMLHGLVDGGFLITSLRPPMTVNDAIAHVIESLRAAGASEMADLAPVLENLASAHARLRLHNSIAEPDEGVRLRAAVARCMTGLVPSTRPALAVDVRLDAQIAVPRSVLDEAALAADVLLRVTTQPFGSAAWLDYHTRFRDRYGPGALVPVLELVADSGLGYPAGYLGAPRARPAWRVVTERDVRLMAMIQGAILDGADEIQLDDAGIEALAVGDHATAMPPSRVELGVAVYAPTTQAVDRGDFELQVMAAPRIPTSMAGRFAHLLDPAEREQLARSYAAPDGEGALAVQLSFPPRLARNQNVVRAGRIGSGVVALSEHPDADAIYVGELAVTADSEHMYLVRQSTGTRLVPYIPHALDTTVQMPPLARFLAEIPGARSAMFGPFEHGAAARNLPYLPAIRYRRVILAPARWLLTRDDVTGAGPDVSGPAGGRWAEALNVWRQRWRVPARVVACRAELRLPLDLDKSLDRALLDYMLTRADRLELQADGAVSGYGWTGRPMEFLIPMTLATPPARRLPVTGPPGRTMHPGGSAIVHARLAGNPARADQLLTTHLPALADDLAALGVLRWWIRRHRDTIRVEADQQLSVFFRLESPAAYGPVAARLAEFAADLGTRRLPADLTLAPYHQHPGRYGTGHALLAAEKVFAADTTAAIGQLRAAQPGDVLGQALAAASMARLAAAFARDSATGYRALLGCLRGHCEPADRAVTDAARRLADPADGYGNLRAIPGGNVVAAAGQARDTVLREYYDILLTQRDPGNVLRTLLHEHHVRSIGVDPEFERKTNHAARAAAMRCLARAGA